MSAPGKWICTNPDCAKAKSREKQKLSTLDPVCGECGWQCESLENAGKKPGLMVAVVLAVIISAIGAYGAYRFFSGRQWSAGEAAGNTALACPSSDVQAFLAKSSSPEDWVRAAKVCITQAKTGESSGYRIRFDVQNGQVSAFNSHGDQVTSFAENDAQAWETIIAKYRLIDALNAAYNVAASPVTITLQQGNGLHRFNERLEFSFDPNSSWRYLLLFDLAGTGELQFLYPLTAQNDPAAVARVPYSLSLQAMPPPGEDDLVAIFCAQPQTKAVALLNSHNGAAAPSAQALLDALDEDCQMGIHPLFTGEDDGTNGREQSATGDAGFGG